MHDMHLRALDLNLLVVLRALIAEKSVTRAAAAVGLSQSATSHALARLRQAMEDQLLVRTPRGMELTPRAKAMAEPLERALAGLHEVVSAPAVFEPGRSRRRFRIATDDYLELVLMPALLARIWREAPGVDVTILSSSSSSGQDLAAARIDIIIDPRVAFGPLPGAYSQRILDDRFVCVVREGHPAGSGRLTLEAFLAHPHALVAPSGRPGGVVDSVLAKRGLRRRVALVLPHFLAAPHIVRQTDVILTVGERIARSLGAGLRLLAPPIPLPRFTVETIWHQRHHADPAHAWFRRVVADVAKAL